MHDLAQNCFDASADAMDRFRQGVDVAGHVCQDAMALALRNYDAAVQSLKEEALGDLVAARAAYNAQFTARMRDFMGEGLGAKASPPRPASGDNSCDPLPPPPGMVVTQHSDGTETRVITPERMVPRGWSAEGVDDLGHDDHDD